MEEVLENKTKKSGASSQSRESSLQPTVVPFDSTQRSIKAQENLSREFTVCSGYAAQITGGAAEKSPKSNSVAATKFLMDKQQVTIGFSMAMCMQSPLAEETSGLESVAVKVVNGLVANCQTRASDDTEEVGDTEEAQAKAQAKAKSQMLQWIQDEAIRVTGDHFLDGAELLSLSLLYAEARWDPDENAYNLEMVNIGDGCILTYPLTEDRDFSNISYVLKSKIYGDKTCPNYANSIASTNSEVTMQWAKGCIAPGTLIIAMSRDYVKALSKDEQPPKDVTHTIYSAHSQQKITVIETVYPLDLEKMRSLIDGVKKQCRHFNSRDFAQAIYQAIQLPPEAGLQVFMLPDPLQELLLAYRYGDNAQDPSFSAHIIQAVEAKSKKEGKSYSQTFKEAYEKNVAFYDDVHQQKIAVPAELCLLRLYIDNANNPIILKMMANFFQEDENFLVEKNFMGWMKKLLAIFGDIIPSQGSAFLRKYNYIKSTLLSFEAVNATASRTQAILALMPEEFYFMAALFFKQQGSFENLQQASQLSAPMAKIIIDDFCRLEASALQVAIKAYRNTPWRKKSTWFESEKVKVLQTKLQEIADPRQRGIVAWRHIHQNSQETFAGELLTVMEQEQKRELVKVKAAYQLHLQFPNFAQSALFPELVYSHGLLVKWRVPITGELEQDLTVLSLNILGSNAASGLHGTKDWETAEEAAQRYDRIAQSLAAGVAENNAQVILLQAADMQRMGQRLQGCLSGQWKIQGSSALGSMICYDSSRLQFIKKQGLGEHIEQKICYMCLQDQVTEKVIILYHLLQNDTGLSAFPNCYEDDCRDLLQGLPAGFTRENVVIIVAGESASRGAPLHNDPCNITTRAVSGPFTKGKAGQIDRQFSDYRNMCFHCGADGLIHQAPLEVLDFVTGQVFEPALSDDPFTELEYKMIACLDNSYKITPLIAGKTIFAYEKDLQQALSGYDFNAQDCIVRIAANSMNGKALAIVFPHDFKNYEDLSSQLQ